MAVGNNSKRYTFDEQNFCNNNTPLKEWDESKQRACLQKCSNHERLYQMVTRTSKK